MLETALNIGREDARRAGKLLERVAPIYAEKRELQEKRLKDGEMFNIFDILGRRTDEVNGHSAFLAALLDPNGQHGQGAKFLAAFCDTMGIKDFDCDNATVDQNMHIGQRGDKKALEGYIDIVIKQRDGKRIIAVENKIYAEDQYNQILRYSAYCKQYGEGNWTLFYLTLDGDKPSDESTGGSLESGKNLAVAEEIASKIDAAKSELFRRNIGKRLLDELKEYGEVKISGNMGKANDGFEIRNKDWPDSVSIWFVFENNNWSDLFSGIYFDGTSKKTQALRNYIVNRSKTDKLWCGEENLSSDDYPYNNYMPSEYRNWDAATLVRIAHGSIRPDGLLTNHDLTDFCNAVKERVGHYASIIDDALKSTG